MDKGRLQEDDSRYREGLEARIKSLLLAESVPTSEISLPPHTPPAKTPEEIAAKIYTRAGRLDYHEDKTLFKRWWDLLPPKLQRELESTAEQFRTIGDYHEELLKSEGMCITRRVAELPTALYPRFIDQAPRISKPEHERLLGRLTDGPSGIEYAHRALKRNLEEYDKYLKQHFGLTGKPHKEEARDRLFSRLNYEGQSYGDIQKEWQKRNP